MGLTWTKGAPEKEGLEEENPSCHYASFCNGIADKTVCNIVQSNKRLTKKLPKQCEVANILVGQVCMSVVVITVVVVVVVVVVVIAVDNRLISSFQQKQNVLSLTRTKVIWRCVASLRTGGWSSTHRPVTVHPAITAKIVSSVFDRSSPNLEHSFPLTCQRKYFVSSPWNGRGHGHVTP